MRACFELEWKCACELNIAADYEDIVHDQLRNWVRKYEISKRRCTVAVHALSSGVIIHTICRTMA